MCAIKRRRHCGGPRSKVKYKVAVVALLWRDTGGCFPRRDLEIGEDARPPVVFLLSFVDVVVVVVDVVAEVEE